MYYKIVMTGGISIFNDKNFFGEITSKEGFFNFEGTNPFPKDEKNKDEELKIWLGEMRKYFFKNEEERKKISAEYSMLYSLKINKKLGENPEIILMHTDTFGGNAAACLNKDIFEKEFNATVKLEKIENLDVTDRIKLNRYLGNFMYIINKYLSEGDKSYMCFAPIGGYKIFSSLGYIVSSFNNLPTAYLHEDQQVLHEIAPVPIELDESFIEENKEFLRKLYIKGIIEEKELEFYQLNLIKENSHFFEFYDGMLALNSFGNFIFEQDKFKHIFGTRVSLSQDVINVINRNKSAEKFIYQQIGVLLKKIENKESDTNLYHEREFRILNDKKLKYHLYKGASNGIHVFRAAWKYDSEERNLYINFIWLDHDVYEREAVKGKGLKEESIEFKDSSKKVYRV